MAPREVYRFGPFTLDAAERRLTKEGRVIPLAPKAHDLLVALVRDAGHLVSKSDLLARVWSDSFVEEGILAVHISTLRKTLDDNSRTPWCIETVAGTGYRFIAGIDGSVSQTSPSPAPDDYELVGRGRFHLLSASRSEVPNAIEAYRTAIEHEPTYAAAHAGLALACCAQAEMRLADPSAAYAKAKESALRALAMDTSCADAQVALGVVMFLGEWNWMAAERCFRRALELNPNHTEAYLLLGRVLEATGLLEAGLSMKMRALERDPHSPLVHVQIALSYWNQRRYDDVIRWSEKTLALDSSHLVAREFLAGAYLKKADVDRYMAECMTHADAAGTRGKLTDSFQASYSEGGRSAAIKDLLARTAAGECALPEMQLALMHGDVGEMDAAFAHLNAAIDARDPALVHLAVAPQWDMLRADPRFRQCLDRMGLAAPAT